jgi:hypothetical protein
MTTTGTDVKFLLHRTWDAIAHTVAVHVSKHTFTAAEVRGAVRRHLDAEPPAGNAVREAWLARTDAQKEALLADAFPEGPYPIRTSDDGESLT